MITSLKSLSPMRQSDSLEQSKAKQMSQLQTAVAGAPTDLGRIRETSQQLAGVSQAALGQSALQAQKTSQTQLGAATQNEIQKKANEAQQRLFELDTQKNAKKMELDRRLGSLDSKAKQNLHDEQLKIRRDAQGRAILTERQLLDHAITSAVSEEDFKAKANMAELISRREIEMWSAAAQKLELELANKLATAETEKDREQVKYLAALKREADKQMIKKQNAAKNRMTAWQTGGMIVGAAAGAMAGGNPYMGAMIGSQVGGAAGSLAGTTSESKRNA